MGICFRRHGEGLLDHEFSEGSPRSGKAPATGWPGRVKDGQGAFNEWATWIDASDLMQCDDTGVGEVEYLSRPAFDCGEVVWIDRSGRGLAGDGNEVVHVYRYARLGASSGDRLALISCFLNGAESERATWRCPFNAQMDSFNT